MKKLVEKIRQKPHHEKNRIILITVIVAVVVLLGAWAVIGIPTRSNNSGDVINQVTNTFEEKQNTLPDLFPKN